MLETVLKEKIQNATKDGKAALALSGGIDSAILAKFMPKGSKAYTFKCVVPGMKVTDESVAAAKYAEECGLDHEIIEIYWEDIEKYLPAIMKRKGAPVHSIEIQIYKAALVAKKAGFNKLLFGESADCIYGGLSGLLSRDWSFGEFVERYSYVMPHKVLKDSMLILEPYYEYEKNGIIDVHKFLNEFFYKESVGSYTNACGLAGVEFISPYAETYLKTPLDIERIRRGENKYLVREVFNRLYSNFEIPPKLPMPRATSEWLKDWEGPSRDEFWKGCVKEMTGDQKWLVYCLEQFLNFCDRGEL